MATNRLLISTTLLLIANVQAFSGFGREVDFYIEEAAQRYQVSKPMLRGLVKMEDGWENAVSPTGATGVGQFTVGTWNWLSEKEEGKALGMAKVTPQNKGTRYDPRRNKRINTLATGLLARWHIGKFTQRGIAVTDANLYLAHNIGLDGFHRALLGKSTLEDVRNMRRNGMKKWMSVPNFIAYQKNRYYQHKLVANANKMESRSTIKAKKNEELAIVANVSENLPTARTAEPLIKRKQPTLRWIQPSDKDVVWVNPIHKL